MTGRGLPPAAAAGAAGAVLALGWLATLWLMPWSDTSVGDIHVRQFFAEQMLAGGLPYRDFAFEYPPLAAPFVVLPGLLGTKAAAFETGFALMTLVLAGVVVWACGALARATRGSGAAAMAAAAAAPLLLGAIVRLHFDLAPVALTLVALVALLHGRSVPAGILLGLALMTKGFPLAAVPPVLAWIWAYRGRATAARAFVAVAAPVAVLGALALALSPSGALEAVGYQLGRPPQVESAQATVMLALAHLPGQAVETVDSHASAAFVGPLDGVVGIAFLVALLAGIAALTLACARARDAKEPGRLVVLAALGAVAAFAATGRVVSPQFLIWIVPLMALAASWRMWPLAAASAAACAFTLAEFPSRYFDLVDRDPTAIALTAVRNLALVSAAALALAGALKLARRSGRAPAPPP